MDKGVVGLNGKIKPGKSLNPAGRPKGIIDNRILKYNIHDSLVKRGFDPIDAMIEMAANLDYPLVIRQRALMTIWDRLLPSLRAIEHTLSDQTTENLAKLKCTMVQLVEENKRDY